MLFSLNENSFPSFSIPLYNRYRQEKTWGGGKDSMDRKKRENFHLFLPNQKEKKSSDRCCVCVAAASVKVEREKGRKKKK